MAPHASRDARVELYLVRPPTHTGNTPGSYRTRRINHSRRSQSMLTYAHASTRARTDFCPCGEGAMYRLFWLRAGALVEFAILLEVRLCGASPLAEPVVLALQPDERLAGDDLSFCLASFFCCDASGDVPAQAAREAARLRSR